jgi:hypothetical protein
MSIKKSLLLFGAVAIFLTSSCRIIAYLARRKRQTIRCQSLQQNCTMNVNQFESGGAIDEIIAD